MSKHCIHFYAWLLLWTGNPLINVFLTMQMPKGVPVATVAIDNSTNAGLLAVRILARSNSDLRERSIFSVF